MADFLPRNETYAPPKSLAPTMMSYSAYAIPDDTPTAPRQGYEDHWLLIHFGAHAPVSVPMVNSRVGTAEPSASQILIAAGIDPNPAHTSKLWILLTCRQFLMMCSFGRTMVRNSIAVITIRTWGKYLIITTKRNICVNGQGDNVMIIVLYSTSTTVSSFTIHS